ncbi:hypothetical protein KTJ32_07165 [Acinetobacter gyllenbergii]|nr:hypothetical protein [Acinetobacter gyllenbergii]MCU4580768.1 hypothetical protein [Acinetobacter gyllenbergii]
MAKILALKRAGKQDHVDHSELQQACCYAAVLSDGLFFGIRQERSHKT